MTHRIESSWSVQRSTARDSDSLARPSLGNISYKYGQHAVLRRILRHNAIEVDRLEHLQGRHKVIRGHVLEELHRSVEGGGPSALCWFALVRTSTTLSPCSPQQNDNLRLRHSPTATPAEAADAVSRTNTFGAPWCAPKRSIRAKHPGGRIRNQTTTSTKLGSS